jgi:acyl carrier protein
MDTEAITRRIRKIVVEQMDLLPEQVKPESRLDDDLTMDSLAKVELQMALEEEFSLELSDDRVATIDTVADAVAAVAAALRERSLGEESHSPTQALRTGQ